MSTFRASVQYGDWEGTASADASDQTDLHKYLKEKGLLHDNEFLVAANLWAGENHHGKVDYVSVRAYIYEGRNSLDELKRVFDRLSGPIPVREVVLRLTLEEFIGMFKRFDVSLTWHSLGLTDCKYEVTSSSDVETE